MMEDSPVTTHKSRIRLSATKNRRSSNKNKKPKQRVSKDKEEPESPEVDSPLSLPNSISSTPTFPTPSRDSSVSTPRDEDDYRNHEIYTSSPFTVACSQLPPPGKEVFWNFDTPQAKKLREKMKAEASPILPIKKMAVPRQRMQIAKSRREPMVSTEDSEKCQEVFEEFLALCKPMNTPMDENINKVEIKNEDKKIDELETKFQQSSMSPKQEVNNVNEIKTERESIDDLFGEDMDDVSDLFCKNGTVSFERSDSDLFEKNCTDAFERNGSDSFEKYDIDIVRTEKQEINSIKHEAVENIKIGKVSTSALFEDDDDSFLLQCTQAAELEVKHEHQIIVKSENYEENNFNVPKSVISTGPSRDAKPVVEPSKSLIDTKLVTHMNKPVPNPTKSVSMPTKPVSIQAKPVPVPTRPVSIQAKPVPVPTRPVFIQAKLVPVPTKPLKDITLIIQPNKTTNPVIDQLTAEDEFGDDDSFDMLMSQMSEEDVIRNEPVKTEVRSPVLSSKSSKRRKCFQLEKSSGINTSPVLRNPVLSKLKTSFKRFKSADDMETKPATKTSSLSVRRIQSSPSIPQYQIKEPLVAAISTSKIRQTSGPVNPAKYFQASRPANLATNRQTSETKEKSSLVKCSKEDIDKKRREAMKKRQFSQNSQQCPP